MLGPMISTTTKYVAGASIGLIGAFLLFRQWEKYKARKELEELKRRAVTGDAKAKAVLDRIGDVLASNVTGSTKKLQIPDHTLACSVVFPFTPAQISVIPGMAEALANLRLKGECS
jgi:hypothetical protein